MLVSSVEATVHSALLEHTHTIASGAREHELCALVLRYLGVDDEGAKPRRR